MCDGVRGVSAHARMPRDVDIDYMNDEHFPPPGVTRHTQDQIISFLLGLSSYHEMRTLTTLKFSANCMGIKMSLQFVYASFLFFSLASSERLTEQDVGFTWRIHCKIIRD